MNNLLNCFCLLLLSLFACQVQAADLTVYTEEFPPFNFTDSKKITGVSTEVVKRMLDMAGFSATLESLPWKDAYSLAQTQKNTLIAVVPKNWTMC